jgi:hypothetical protein
MNDNFTTLLNMCANAAQITGKLYKNWDSDFVYKEVFEGLDRLKTHYASLNIDYTQITSDELRSVGFKHWDDEEKHLLIPIWLFRLLPDDEKLYSPLIDENSIELKKDCDDDYRFGCVAFSLAVLKDRGTK